MHVGIIGAGITGLTAAWLLDTSDVSSITLFESRDRIGGHAETIPVGDNWADLGAQHVAPTAFPVWTRLLRRLGLDQDLVPCPLSTTICVDDTPVVVTPHPRKRTQPPGPAGTAHLDYLGKFLIHAAEIEGVEDAWRMTAEEFVERLDLPAWFKRDVVYPLLASFVGCSVDRARSLSARASVAFLVRNPPGDAEQPPEWYNVRGGCATVARSLAGELTRTRARLDTSVVRVRPVPVGYEIIDSTGSTATVDRLVFAAAPHDVAALLDSSPRDGVTAELSRLLDRFRFVRSVLGIHRDPRYMPSDRASWSTNNIAVTTDHEGERWAETSTWYGPITGADIFKSWLTHRVTRPTALLATREYRHPIPTVEHVDAQQALLAWQGTEGMYCAGSWTTDIDSQESAVRSALTAARLLAPHCRRVRELDGETETSTATP